jgi:hypothetical protein
MTGYFVDKMDVVAQTTPTALLARAHQFVDRWHVWFNENDPTSSMSNQTGLNITRLGDFSSDL